jgi:hypothetical protein
MTHAKQIANDVAEITQSSLASKPGRHRWMRVKCLVVQQGELAPRTQEHPSQERVGTSMLTQCTLGFEVAHAIPFFRVNTIGEEVARAMHPRQPVSWSSANDADDPCLCGCE